MYMDRAGLEARIFRIEGGDLYATDPLPHTAHLVTNVLIHDQTDDLTGSVRDVDGAQLYTGSKRYGARRTIRLRAAGHT